MREGWKEVELGEVCDVINGFAFKSKDFVNQGIPLVKIKELKDNRLNISDCDYLPKDFVVDPKYYINKGDVVIALTGSHITLPSSAVGRVAKSYLNEALLLNQRVGKFKVFEDKCDMGYLYFILTSEYFFNSVGLLAKGAANQANISASDVKSIKINLPPLETQKKIASILSGYDDLIENNLKRIKILEEMAQQTYEEWFVRMRFPGHESANINPETGLPEGWEKVKLGELGEYLNGFAFKPDDFEEFGYPIIKIKEMKAGLSNDTPRYSGTRVPIKYVVESGDILFSWSASLEVVIWAEEKGYVNQHLFKVTPNDFYSKAFVFLSIKESLRIFDGLTTGATMKHIKRKELDFVIVNKPSKDIMDAFRDKADPMISSILNLTNQNQRLREARDILLPRLMMGMVEV